MDSKIKTQKFGVGEIFGEGWRIYSAQFLTILIIVLCVYISMTVILTMVPVAVLTEIMGADRALQTYQNISRLLEFFIDTIATIAIAFVVEKALLEQPTTWSEALGRGLSRWASAIGTGLLAGIILFGLTLLLIVPGIIWWVYYTFYIYVVAFKGLRGKAALDYSKGLVQGQWWRIFGISFMLNLTGVIVSLALGLLFSLLPSNLILNFITNFILNLVGALFTVMVIVWFINIDNLTLAAENPSASVTETQSVHTVYP